MVVAHPLNLQESHRKYFWVCFLRWEQLVSYGLLFVQMVGYPILVRNSPLLTIYLNIAPEPPKTMTKEWQQASNEKAIEQKQNPLTGMPVFAYVLRYITYSPFKVSLQRVIKARDISKANKHILCAILSILASRSSNEPIYDVG